MLTISSNQSTAISQTTTQPGFLVKIGWTVPVYLSSRGNVAYTISGDTAVSNFVASSIMVTGLSTDITAKLNGSLTIGINSADPSVVMQYALSSSLGFANTPIEIWAFDQFNVSAGALATADALKIFKGIGDQVTISPLEIGVTLIPTSLVTSTAPRVRINPRNGFNWLQPKGTRITWGSETFILE